MIAKEEFEAYKDDFDKKQLKRARTTAVVLALATVLAIIGMLYGLINNIEAGTYKDLAVKNEQTAIEAKLEADRQRDLANEIGSQNVDLKAQLERCKSGK